MADTPIQFTYPIFESQIEPNGRLVIDKRCHAAWFYFMLADKAMKTVGRGPVDQVIVVDPGLETPLWMDKQYHQIAESVATIYGLTSPDEFLPYFDLVILEANRIGFEVAKELLSPFGVGKGGRLQ